MSYDALKRLTATFSVQDIMTPTEQLQRADTLNDALYLLHEYDVVPYPRSDKILGFFQRGSSARYVIEPAHLISNSTNLAALPKLLCQQPFFFVISGNEVIGYIHYSDLNKPITKVPFFAMFQLIERTFWDKMTHRISEKDLKILFSGEASKLIQKKENAATRNTDIGWTGVFSFPYILRLARHYGLAQVTDNEIKLLKETRNRIAHSDQNLVSSFDDVSKLAEAVDIFQHIIKRLFDR